MDKDTNPEIAGGDEQAPEVEQAPEAAEVVDAPEHEPSETAQAPTYETHRVDPNRRSLADGSFETSDGAE